MNKSELTVFSREHVNRQDKISEVENSEKII